ncbi:MAG TPA: class I SAM-dependent methyltransferase [Alphaproteobacteria bacterium]|nr:class I SAM-dependent methyltransferase [Alphaproteobacteria bacterium]
MQHVLRALLGRGRARIQHPAWRTANSFELGGLNFCCDYSDYTQHTTRQRVILLKPHDFIDNYLAMLERIRARNVLEFGIWQGGSALFLALAGRLDRLVGIDLEPPVTALQEILDNHPVGGRVSLHFETSQDDRAAVRSILARDFGAVPLDMIVDDASHFYAQTRASFETTFSYLRPGGLYVIEDWGWAHWPDWQKPDHPWQDREALSNLLFDLTMIIGRNSGLITKIEILGGAMAVITRGDGLAHGEQLDLDQLIVSRGRSLGRI